jgi:rhodanese-related sulfurtransferase
VEPPAGVFVDVREPPEWFGTGLIKEALPVPRGVLEFTVGDQLELDRRVVLYCSNGYRAALAGSTMLDLGFTNVLNGGSFEALVDAGVATEDAAKVSQSKNLKKKERKLRKSSA